MEESHISGIYNNNSLIPKKNTKTKVPIKIQFVNQDLDQAIEEMKVSLKKKMNPSTISQEYNENPETFHDSKLYFTETYKVKYEKKLREIQEKKKIINANSLQKQMKARLQKKIKQNRELKEKMTLLRDLQQNKVQLEQEQFNRRKKNIQEKQLLHQSSMAKVEMMRKSKMRSSLSSLKQSRVIDQESKKQHMFKTYMDEKQRQEHHMLLRTKLQFSLKKSDKIKRNRMIKTSASHRKLQSFKQVSESRPIYTSQNHRSHNIRVNKQVGEDLIIERYAKKSEEDENLPFFQKKLNQGNITPKDSNKIQSSRKQSLKSSQTSELKKQGEDQKKEQKIEENKEKENRVESIDKIEHEGNQQQECEEEGKQMNQEQNEDNNIKSLPRVESFLEIKPVEFSNENKQVQNDLKQ